MTGPLRRALRITWFPLFYGARVVASSFQVARDVRTPASAASPAFIEVPLRARTEPEITAIANMVTLRTRQGRPGAGSGVVFFGFVGIVALLGLRLGSHALGGVVLVRTLVGFLAALSPARLISGGERRPLSKRAPSPARWRAPPSSPWARSAWSGPDTRTGPRSPPTPGATAWPRSPAPAAGSGSPVPLPGWGRRSRPWAGGVGEDRDASGPGPGEKAWAARALWA